MEPRAFQPASGLRRGACSTRPLRPGCSRFLALATALIISVALAACGGSGGSGSSPNPSPDFSVNVGSPTLNVQQELGQYLNVYLTPINGFTGTVTLTVQGSPTGVSVSPSGQIQVPISGAAAVPQDVGFIASNDAAVGSTTITIMATSGTLTHKANFSLVVQAPSSAPLQTNSPPPGRTRYVRADTVTEYADWPNQNWIVYDSNTGQLLMTDPEGSQVVVFNAATETKVASITVPGAFGIDLTPDQSTAYVGTLIGDVYTINTATLTVTNRYVASQIGPSGFQAAEALVMADGRLALLGDGPNLSELAAVDGFGSVAFWNPATNSLSQYNFSNCGGDWIGGFTRSPDRTKPFIGYEVSSGSSSFCEVNESTGQDTFVAAPTGAYFDWVSISPDGNYIALPHYPSQILLYDANTFSLLAQFSLPILAQFNADGVAGSGLIFSADSKTLFVPDAANPLIYAYSVTNQMLTGWFPNLVVQPTGGCSPCAVPVSSPHLQVTDGTGLFAGPVEEGIGFMDFSSPKTSPVGTAFTNGYLSPNTGPTSGATQIEWYLTNPATSVNGSSSIYFGSEQASGVSSSASGYVNATTPPGNPGPADVYLFANDGGVQMLPEAFSYGPTILEVTTPSAASQGGGIGYVYGYGFGPFTASGAPIPSDLLVGVGGVPATVLAYNSDGYGTEGPPLPLESVAFTIPPGSVGPVDVSVTTSAGSTAASDALTYRAPIQQFPLPGSVLFQGIYDPYTDLYYFTDANEIQVFSKTEGQWLSPISIPLPSGATSQRLWGLGLSPDGTKLAVADEAANVIYVLDPSSSPVSIQTFALNFSGLSGPVTINPCGVAISDTGIAYIAGVGGVYKLDTSTGTLTSYPLGGGGYVDGVPLDLNLRITITKDNSRVFVGTRGVTVAIETATDQIIRPSVYICCNAAGYEMALSSDQTKLFGADIIYDLNFNAQSFLTLNDRELPQADYVYGAKWSADGTLLYEPSISEIDVFDGNLGVFRNRLSLPVALSENYDALVSDGTDDVLVAITGQTGNGGIALIDLSSLPEPTSLPYQSDLRKTTSQTPRLTMALTSPPALQSSSPIPATISRLIRHVTGKWGLK